MGPVLQLCCARKTPSPGLRVMWAVGTECPGCNSGTVGAPVTSFSPLCFSSLSAKVGLRKAG